MHGVFLDEQSALGEDTVHQLRLNSPAGEWFPALQNLSWSITESNLPYAHLFFSPQSPVSTLRLCCGDGVPHDILPAAASKISRLPTSSLQLLHVGISRGISSAYFTDSLSALVLRCGPSLTDFSSSIPLSDAAINHLIQLPHLHTWALGGPPPNYSTSPLPLVFPPLAEFTLLAGATHGWFPLLKRLECSVSTTRGATPLHMVKESLRSLSAAHSHDTSIDASFSSTVQVFRNLTRLNVGPYCCFHNGMNRCTFKLNDGNVTELVTALPQLRHITLGRPCPENTCATTVACLLLISIHCTELQGLTIHFNTTNIINDLKYLSEEPRFQELHSLPRCTLWRLKVFQIPLTLDELGFDTVANGMVKIFPSLRRCEGFDQAWRELNRRLKKIQTQGDVNGLGMPVSVDSDFPFI